MRKTENLKVGVEASAFYGSSYHADQVHGALQSARIVLSILFEIYQPQSVFDLGCGQGAWLAAAEELGVRKLVGVDGPWVDPAALISRSIEFSAVDLEKEFAVPEKYDLSISVEVAEHLSAGRSRAFVEALCAASDVVIFSAAIPQQGGVNHINEQWQSFWAALFGAAGYECYDLFRPRLWRDKRVAELVPAKSVPLCAAYPSVDSSASPNPGWISRHCSSRDLRRQSGEFQASYRTTITTFLRARAGTLVQ